LFVSTLNKYGGFACFSDIIKNLRMRKDKNLSGSQVKHFYRICIILYCLKNFPEPEDKHNK
jgi:hypothetical protein